MKTIVQIIIKIPTIKNMYNLYYNPPPHPTHPLNDDTESFCMEWAFK